MITRLEGHISEKEITAIVNMIKEQYQKFLQLTGSGEFKSIFLEEYAQHKRQYGVSWAISSAFPSNITIPENLKVERLKYGKGHARPILSNDVIELHILNRTTHFDATYLKKRYQYNRNDFLNKKLFAYIKFSADCQKLTALSLCLPDQNGCVVEEMALLEREFLNGLAA